MTGPEIARALEYLNNLTGDPVFGDALRALRSYELDRALKQQADDVSTKIFGDPDSGFLAHMRYLLKRKGCRSIRAAARQVATEHSLTEPSRDAVVDRLRRKFANWQTTPPASGDLGYAIEVTPLRHTTDEHGAPLVGPASARATLWWRRRWDDGDITVRKLG